jgi:hypothetical protein
VLPDLVGWRVVADGDAFDALDEPPGVHGEPAVVLGLPPGEEIGEGAAAVVRALPQQRQEEAGVFRQFSMPPALDVVVDDEHPKSHPRPVGSQGEHPHAVEGMDGQGSLLLFPGRRRNRLQPAHARRVHAAEEWRGDAGTGARLPGRTPPGRRCFGARTGRLGVLVLRPAPRAPGLVRTYGKRGDGLHVTTLYDPADGSATRIDDGVSLARCRPGGGWRWRRRGRRRP